MHQLSGSNPPSRRELIQAGAAAAALTAGAPLASAAPRGRRGVLKIGLVGCGGRGTGAAKNALAADPEVELVALGDTFADHAENSLKTLTSMASSDDSETQALGKRVVVPPENVFVGFDAYKQVIDACDVVLLATTPHFRPLHVAYAVEKGKHMFVEKPIATDAPGVRSVIESCKQAKAKGLSVVSGLCYRYSSATRETLQRVHDGAIGDIVALECTYNTGGLWHRGRKPEWSEMEYQVRNWLYFTWASGDHITEQHIHSLDKIAWAMQDEYPVAATASGGRVQRTDPKYGNVYDHFNTVYEWANGVKCFSSCRQWNGAKSNVSDFVHGTKGQASLQAHKITGADKWRWRKKEGEVDDMYQNEHDALFASIRSGEPINNGEYMCNSTLMAILARMAAYTGQRITWDQALNSQEDLSPPAYEWSDLETRPVAVPGVRKFV
ncbi:MAG: Gfo/Idh/MocA family oxidoreductase [bacterium]|nr:Gfo/Idh/MocA family oxidoreductase [bacterium]